MTDETTQIATAAAMLDDPYATLSQHLHGDGDAPPLRITYRNWRGEVSERNIVPQSVWFGATEWHPEPQWLLSALDTDKGAARDFALADFGASDDTWRARALAAEAEVERLGRVMQEIASANYPACPFDRADCQVAPDEPCPVCGDKNTLDQVSQCASLGASAVARAALAEGGPDDR